LIVQRLKSAYYVVLASVVSALVLLAAPQQAQAHVSIHDTSSEILDEADDLQSHCHGEIECVITLFPANLDETLFGRDSIAGHVHAVTKALKESDRSHDPPVPILSIN